MVELNKCEKLTGSKYDAYEHLALMCLSSAETACKATYRGNKIAKCINNPDRYLKLEENLFRFKVGKNMFKYGTLSGCNTGACNYIWYSGAQSVLVDMGRSSKPDGDEDTVESAEKTEKAETPKFEANNKTHFLINASNTNLELYVEEDRTQELSIGIPMNNLSYEIRPRPTIKYTLKKVGDIYEFSYEIKTGNNSIGTGTLTFNSTPKLGFEIILEKENDLSSVKSINLVSAT